MRGDRPYSTLSGRDFTMFTPHARGSTVPIIQANLKTVVYPACAGIDHSRHTQHCPSLCLPRMRGDRPDLVGGCLVNCEFTPHARGSTQWSQHQPEVWAVYPACAGIDHSWAFCSSSAKGLPRMRGDRPQNGADSFNVIMFTPHARGSTVVHFTIILKYAVYPACAGIDLCFHT